MFSFVSISQVIGCEGCPVIGWEYHLRSVNSAVVSQIL